MRQYRPRTPSLRNLDLYRLVIVRRQRQIDVAREFGINQSNVSRALARVRDWVDWTTEPWLYRDRHDLRFYAALDRGGFHVRECSDPYIVLIRHARGFPSYGRSTTGNPEAEIAAMQQSMGEAPRPTKLQSDPHIDLQLRKASLRPVARPPSDAADASQCQHGTCASHSEAATRHMLDEKKFPCPPMSPLEAATLDLTL